MKKPIEDLAKRQIYLGTSSWKYEGWKGTIYNKSYGSEKAFKEESLMEYATHYPAVGVDHTYYSYPTPKLMEKYKAQTPEHFKFGMKVTEEITVLKYPKLSRYGKRAGLDNPAFLSPEIFEERFLHPLEPIKDRLGPLMLEFSQFYPGMLSSGSEFVERLDTFFSKIQAKGFQLSVEMRNANWLKPPYLKMLEKQNVAHVFNSWTRMPKLLEQFDLTEGVKFPLVVSRLLLSPGTQYAEAVEAFSPYDKIQEIDTEVREGAAKLIRRALTLGIPAFVFVNIRCEGSAPHTIEAILKLLSLD